jgi:hypothetical protein
MYLYIHVSQITCIQNESKFKANNKSLFTYNIKWNLLLKQNFNLSLLCSQVDQQLQHQGLHEHNIHDCQATHDNFIL